MEVHRIDVRDDWLSRRDPQERACAAAGSDISSSSAGNQCRQVHLATIHSRRPGKEHHVGDHLVGAERLALIAASRRLRSGSRSSCNSVWARAEIFAKGLLISWLAP